MRKLALLLGVVTALVGVWVMFQTMRPGDAPVGLEEGVSSDMSPGEAMRAEENPAGEESDEASDPALDRSVVEPVKSGTGAGSMLRILVVEKEAQSPVPGAEVAYTNTSANRLNNMNRRDQEEYRRLSRDTEESTHHYGTSVVADIAGVALVPVTEEDVYLTIVGRREELYGQLRVRPDDLADADSREVVLELEPDLTLSVRVLDSLGNPAIDVPIAIVPEGSEMSDFYGYLEVATTESPEGLARIPHLQEILRARRRLGQNSTSYRVVPHIPGWLDPGELFNITDPPEGPFVFRLPATGRVVVETGDLDGAEEHYTYLVIAPDPEGASDPSPLMQEVHRRVTEDGDALFKWVVTGKNYEASSNVRLESLREEFTGPLAEGHEVRVTLMPKTESYDLVGRVVDQRLEPVRNTRFRAPYETSDGLSRTRTFTTDDDGRFLITVGREKVTLTMLAIQPGSVVGPADHDSGMFLMKASLDLAPGENDLGDVVLTASPIVATGQIFVDGRQPEREKFTLRVELLENIETTERWRGALNLGVTYPGDGRFEVRGVSRPTRYRISLSGGLGSGGRLDYLPVDPVEFVAGQRDLTVELLSGGSLQASVLIDESVSVGNLWLRLESADTVREDEGGTLRIFSRLYGQEREERDGLQVFRWGALWPGTYRLAILSRGSRMPVTTIEGIRIGTGQRVRDPRLDGIDLRGKFRQIKVEVQDENGRPMASSGLLGPMVLIDPSSEGEVQGFNVVGGVATVETGEPTLDLVVTASGYQPRQLTGVREDTAVSLEPYREVLVRISGEVRQIPEGHVLRVALTRKGRQPDHRLLVTPTFVGPQVDRALHPRQAPQDVDEHGEVALQVEDDGMYTVAVSVRNLATGQTGVVRDAVPAEIQVQTAAVRQVFEVRISEAGLRRALIEAGGR